jgi:hypothetical protein
MSLLVAKIASLGAMAGALAGAVAAAGWLVIFAPRDLGAVALGALIAAPIGAVFGAVLFPLAGFTVLRQIPLWRIIVLTLVGASAGGIIGAQYLGSAWLVGPVVGFCAAVSWLAIRARGKKLPSSAVLCAVALLVPAARINAQSAHDELLTRSRLRLYCRYSPNHRASLDEPNFFLSARRSFDGSMNLPAGFGPEKKSISTVPTLPAPNSM